MGAPRFQARGTDQVTKQHPPGTRELAGGDRVIELIPVTSIPVTSWPQSAPHNEVDCSVHCRCTTSRSYPHARTVAVVHARRARSLWLALGVADVLAKHWSAPGRCRTVTFVRWWLVMRLRRWRSLGLVQDTTVPGTSWYEWAGVYDPTSGSARHFYRTRPVRVGRSSSPPHQTKAARSCRLVHPLCVRLDRKHQRRVSRMWYAHAGADERRSP